MSAKINRLYRPDEYERRSGDFYPTPAWVTECLLHTVPLRGVVWEPCAGQGAMAKVIAAAGHQVIATDLTWMNGSVFPVVGGVDALQSPLPAGVRSITTNPPYSRDILPRLVGHWLGLLEPLGGQLCLLLRSLWGESQGGQALTTKHPAYHGRIKLPGRIRWLEGTNEDKGVSPQHEHCWVCWNWSRDERMMPFEISAGDPRLKGCLVCGAPLDGRRRHATVCSNRCRVARSRRRGSNLRACGMPAP
jgi:predicted nucleic acid-binding Zn ribbon protein